MKKFALLLALLLVLTEPGRILNGDVIVDYANAGSMTTLSFSFQLTNSITSSDYIKIALPFPLHSSLIPAYPAMQGLSSPLSLILTYQYMDMAQNILPTVYYGQILTETIDSSNYYIQFYASDKKTLIPIPGNQWFYITFTIQATTPLQYQTSNNVLQIQMSTVSSVWTNAMVYDDNLAFNYFQLAATPSQLISVSATPYNYGNAGGYLLTQQSYMMYLDVSLNLPTYYFTESIVLKFLISQKNSFLFNGSCNSVAKNNAPTIALLSSNYYTCSVDPVNNVMVVVLSATGLATQKSYRFTVGMINPSIVAKSVSIIVNAVKQTSGVILGYGSASGVLNTNQIYITYQEIFLGWGLRPDALLPFDARVYRGNAATPTYMPYNSLTVKFSISQTTSSSNQLKIVINIPSEATAFVLPNAFTFNLPAFPNKQVICTTQYASSTTSRRIGCTGVGALSTNTVYFIGWKMYFPYDNYQSSINCTQFGLLTIYTTTAITANDNAYFLGRGDSYLNYLKQNANYYLIGRNSSYISYMTTFPNINLVVLSSDFQEFLSTPELIFVNNRPTTYSNKQFNDVYVITQNLAFLNYISQFTDIYVAVLIKQNTDIVNGYNTYPLVATTTPKNTLAITTSNSQDWSDFVTNTSPLLSSTAALSGTVAGTSLLKTNNYQSLIFSMKAPYASVTSFSSTAATTITNNWGMMIMMSPNFVVDSNATLVISETSLGSSPLTPTITSITSATAYNKYTLVTIRGYISDNLQKSFPVTATKTSFGLFPFRLNAFSSIYTDSNNFDIMICTLDGIDGPLNKITYNGFFLINGFTLSAAATGTINMGFINYQSSTPMDGSIVPTLLRLKGTVSTNSTTFDSMVIFFDKLTPFFSNYLAGQINCYNTGSSNPCKYYLGASSVTTGNEKYNYQSLSRIEVPLSSPSTAFNAFIPVTFAAAQTLTNFYVAFQTINNVTGQRTLEYVEALRSISISNTAIVSGNYGPTVVANTVGQNVSNLLFKANSPITLTVNSANTIGSAFSYFSEWDYFQSTSISGWSTYGTCYKMSYLYYITNYAAFVLGGTTFSYKYKLMTGLVCTCDLLGSVTAAQLTLSTGYLPSKWGQAIPGYGAISQNDGSLRYYQTTYQNIGVNLNATNIVFPSVGPTMINSVGTWIIPLPIGLDSSVQITIKGNPANTNLPFTFTGTCAIYFNSAKIRIGCNFVSSPSQIDYTLTILESGLLPSGSNFSIVHYGLSSNSSYNNVNVDITCYSLLTTASPGATQLIFQALAVQFPYSPASYIGPTTLTLGSFAQWTSNKAAIQTFTFSFTLLNKGLYVTNRIRFDLGQFALDNSGASTYPSCSVYTYSPTGSTSLSHDWDAVDSSNGFNNLQIWPSTNLISNNLTYTITCTNFLSTSSPTPVSIAAKVVNTSSDLTGELNQASSITLSVLNVIGTNCQIVLSKKYSIPSIGMEMTFTVTSPGVTSDSFLYLNFPSYYSNGLGPDIKCYSYTAEIYCYVINKQLVLQYMGTYNSGTTFALTVVGVTMSINYNSGTFSYIFDTDNNPTSIQAAGTFTDAVSATVLTIQNFPTIPVFQMTQTSSYLRDESVTISLNFYLDTTLPAMGLGQQLFLVFPPIYSDILRFQTPTCTLNILGNTLKNYISTCTVKGLRLKMPFLDTIIQGSTYTLTVGNVINPTYSSSNVFKYSLEITDSTDTSIIAKSYSVNCNYVMPTFISNPIRIYLNYYLVDGTAINSLSTVANIQSNNIYISASSTLSSSIYQRNTYLSPLSNLQSNPSSINILSGGNPFPIRLSALSSGVNYLYFSKTGDGDYYQNLPPLTMTTNKNYFTAVTFVETSFNLPVDAVGTNYTLTVTLPSSLYPLSQVNMNVALSSSVGISLRVNPTVISFFPTKVVASIALYINDATLWTVARTTNLVITPTDAQTYASGATIPLTGVAPSLTPILTLTTSSSTVKQLNFNVKCSQHSKFIYHLSRKYQYNLTACSINASTIEYWLNQNSIDSLRVAQTYYQCQDVIGVINVAANVSQTLSIPNLYASTIYTLDGFCSSQKGIQSSLTSLDYSTANNGGIISVMDFAFSSALSTAQKIKLVCALALYFKVDYTKVSTWDGYYCSELLNRRLLFGQEDNERILATSSYTTRVFFGINTQNNNDNSYATISTQSTLSTLLNSINSNVTGLPTLMSYTAAAASYIGPNDVSGSLNVGVGPNYVYITNLTLSNNGLIYVIIGDNSVWPRSPLISEIKTGSGPGGLAPVYFKVLPYYANNSTSGYVVWTGMPAAGTYTMYVMTSDANPFDSANFATIRNYTIIPEIPSYELPPFTIAFIILFMIFIF